MTVSPQVLAAMSPVRVSKDDPRPEGVTDDIPLLDQSYIRDSGKTIQTLVTEGIARLGENVVVRRFTRFELGAKNLDDAAHALAARNAEPAATRPAAHHRASPERARPAHGGTAADAAAA